MRCAQGETQRDTECVLPLREGLDLSLVSALIPPVAQGAQGWGAARLEEV